jgi:hypothetical protein
MHNVVPVAERLTELRPCFPQLLDLFNAGWDDKSIASQVGSDYRTIRRVRHFWEAKLLEDLVQVACTGSAN